MEQLIRQCGKGIKCIADDYLPGLKALHHPCDLLSWSQPEEGRQGCILINGVPNIGKSYFCRQLTKEILEGQAHSNRMMIPLLCKVDWESIHSLNERSPTSHTQARGEDSTSRNCGTQGEAESSRSDPCPLRELLGIITPRCISNEEIDIPAICNHFTESQGEEIVLICDLVEGESLDSEEGLVPKTVIQPLLKNLTSILPHCTLLLASRPDRVAELMKTLGKIKIRPHLFGEVLGFTRTSVDAFVDQRNCEVLKMLLKQFTWLYSVCRVPKVVNDLCKTTIEWNPVSDSDESALAKLCECIGLRLPSQEGYRRLPSQEEHWRLPSPEEHLRLPSQEEHSRLPSPEEHWRRGKLGSLCEKAFNCIVTSHQQSHVLFEDPPWHQSLSTLYSNFLCLDVVKDYRISMEPFPVYYYASDAVQEYLAALHVASLSDLQLLKTAAERCANVLPSDSPRLKQVLLFFSALSKFDDRIMYTEFINAYLEKRAQNAKTSSVLNHKVDPWHLAWCLYEAENLSLLKNILPFKKNKFFSNFSIPIHSQYDINVIHFLLKQCHNNDTREEGHSGLTEGGSMLSERGHQQTVSGRQQTTDDVITVEFMEDLNVMEGSLVPQWENLGPSIISFSHPPPGERASCESTCVRENACIQLRKHALKPVTRPCAMDYCSAPCEGMT